MKFVTGYTITTIVPSLDFNNNPVSATSFNTEVYQNGVPYTGITLNIMLADPVLATFNFSFSASTIGDYQFYAFNNATSAVFISDTFQVVSSPFDANIYIGL